MTVCAKCMNLPRQMPERGVIYIAAATSTTEEKIKQCLDTLSLPYTSPHPDILAAFLASEQFVALGKQFSERLNQNELRECKYYMLADAREMEFRHLQKAESLQMFITRAEGDWLLGLLAEGRYFSEFQPIVFSNEPQKIYAYEGLFRGRELNGTVISPHAIFSVARSTQLLHPVDFIAREAVIHDAVKYGIDINLFINFFPSAIHNPEYSAAEILRELYQAGIHKDRVVFEVVESEEIRDIKTLAGVLEDYREAGFRIALDDLGSAYSSLNLMSLLHPDFIKIDMELIRNVNKDNYKAHIVSSLLNIALRLGIQAIVEGVENWEEWEWLRNNGASLMQGFLFAKPAAPPPRSGFYTRK